MLVGVISDTHGLLRPAAVEALRPSDLIIHAGDIGAPEILDELRQLAPLYAIRGNVDTQRWSRDLPLTEVVEIGSLFFYVLHDLKALDLNPRAARFAAVVSGHSHQPGFETRDGVLYFNPGSAGPKRFRLPITLGRIHIERGRLKPEILTLPES